MAYRLHYYRRVRFRGNLAPSAVELERLHALWTRPWFRRVLSIREATAVKRLPRATGQALPVDLLICIDLYT